MNTIQLTYRHFFRTRTIETTFPSCWSEMTAGQFMALCSRPDDITLLSIMLNVSPRIIRRLSGIQTYELAQLFSFIKRDTKVSSFTLKTIFCKGIGTLYAPKPKLAEMTFIQFIYVDSFYMQYANSGKVEILRDFVSYLYSPFSGYSKSIADRNTDRLRKIDVSILESIALNYGMLREWIIERYPLIFPSARKEIVSCSSGSWSDVFDSLVGDDLKDRDKYAEVPVNVVFKYLTRKIKESRKNGSKIH
ncbi:MAG: hypothetical protein RSA98_07920 [Odoribacter sp.]